MARWFGGRARRRARGGRAVLSVPPVPAPPTPGFSGVATWTSTAQQVTDEMEVAAWAGSQMVRVDLYWDLVEQTEGVRDWTLADARFDAADAAGLRVLWLVHASPAWARTDGEASNVWLPTDTADYVAFLTAAVNRYKTRGTLGCHHWQVWNEINTVWHIGDPEDYARYVEVLTAAHGAIKAADPSATVVLGPILRGGQEDAEFGAVRDTTYLTNLYAAGAKPYFDVLSYHPYSYPFDPASTTEPVYTAGLSPEHGWQGIAPIRAIMASNGDSSKALWLTEWGQHTGTATSAATEAQQATFVANAFTRATTEDVQALFVFAPRNAGTDATNREHNFGMVEADFTTKPALRAYRAGAAELVGATPVDPTTAAAPTFVAAADSGVGFASTRTTAAITGSQAGDVLIAFAGANDQATTISASDGGWTLRGTVALDNARLHVLTKTATGAQGSVTWTYSGAHNHRVSVVCYRGAVEPTSVAATATSRLQTAKLENLPAPKAGAMYVVAGYAANFVDGTPTIGADMTARITDGATIGGGMVADQAFIYSDDWTSAKTFDATGADTSATLILAAGVLIASTATPGPLPDPLTYDALVLSDSPLIYLPLATDAVDTGPNGLHGTVNGGTFAAGRLRIDAAGEYVILPNSATLRPTTAISVEAWVEADTIAANQAIWTGSETEFNNFILIATNRAKVQLDTTVAGGGTTTLNAAASSISPAAEHHLVFTYDGANVRMYCDGTQIATAAQTGAIAWVASNQRLGARLAATERLTGYLRRFALYNRALTVDEIQEHRTAGL